MPKTTRKKVTPAPKKAAAKNRSVAPAKKVLKKIAKKAPQKGIVFPLPKNQKHILYVDSSLFFPQNSQDGYADNSQNGRHTLEAGLLLQAPILLPVGAKINSITIYYKNNTSENMPVVFLKKHIDHHAPSGEVEVSLDNCPPGTLAPDDFLAKLIDHFENAGIIRDKYLYFLQILNTARTEDTQLRTVRGMRVDYQYK